MNLMDKTQQIARENLQAKSIPKKRAEVKAEGTAVGKLVAAVGLVFVAASVGLAVILAKDQLTIVELGAMGTIGTLGFLVFGIGATLISRDAAPAIALAGEITVKWIRAIRGKNGIKGD